MRVQPIKQAGSGRVPYDAALETAEHDADSRALVVIAPPDAQNRTVIYRQAPFLAHLIATREQLPQTRERRRAEPSEAIAAYRAVEAITRHH